MLILRPPPSCALGPSTGWGGGPSLPDSSGGAVQPHELRACVRAPTGDWGVGAAHLGKEIHRRGERSRESLPDKHLAGPAEPAARSGPLPPAVPAVPVAALTALGSQRGRSPESPSRPCRESSDSGPVTQAVLPTRAVQSVLAGQWNGARQGQAHQPEDTQSAHLIHFKSLNHIRPCTK